MITKIFYLLLSLIIGFAGYYFGKTNNQQADTIRTVEKIVYVPTNTKKPKSIITNKIKPKTQKTSQYLPEYLPNQETFNKIIDNLSPPELDDYLNKIVAKNDPDFNQIYDKHSFAKSLIREFLGERDHSNISTNSTLDFSLSTNPNTDETADFALSDSTKTIFAHLQLDQNTAAMGNTFIKWVNVENGKVLLFEKKNINPITKQNWVSFTPDKNWQSGNYQVTFYQFNSELNPIIQGNYHIE